MTLQFNIRHSKFSDFDAIYKMWREMNKLLGPPIPAAIRKLCASGKILVATSGEALLGFCNFNVRRRDGVAVIYEVAVSPIFRKSRIGMHFVNAVLDASPVGVIRLKCKTDNPANLFYKKCGFTVIGTEPSTKSNLYLWEKTNAHPNNS